MTSPERAPITVEALLAMKAGGERIACLTAYDAGFAHWLDAAGVEVILVGDSLGMVLQGHESTLPVSVDDMVYHAAAVARGSSHALRVVDMPYRSYDTPDRALATARRLVDDGRAQMVKLEGGAVRIETVKHLVANGMAVCGHLGLLPQSVEELGGYRVQGRDETSARQIHADALALEAAGASLLVLECVPRRLAAEITAALRIPVIGIGAGPDCDGQVLVLYDLLGITPGKRPRFSKDFLAGNHSIAAAIDAYVADVKAGRFPTAAESFE
jgi:3-methyl-2-oxobutanoate hydroxymethyltransferase